MNWQKLVTVVLILSAAGCTDFLDEEAISLQTADSYYVTPEGFEDLSKSIYPLLRDITALSHLQWVSGEDHLNGSRS